MDWELFAITAWSLWNNRNTLRHRGRSKRFDAIVKEVEEYAKEVRHVQQVPTRPQPAPPPPPDVW